METDKFLFFMYLFFKLGSMGNTVEVLFYIQYIHIFNVSQQ